MIQTDLKGTKKLIIEYNRELFRSDDIKECAERFLEALPLAVTGLLSTGSSGCSIAAAMLTLTHRRLIHTFVRKTGESAHYHHGGQSPDQDIVYAIVDDFI